MLRKTVPKIFALVPALFLFLAVLSEQHQICCASPQSKPRWVSFKSAGHTIRTEWFDAVSSSDGTQSVLVILPGSGGIEKSGGFFRDLAISMANSGVTAVIVHYMDRNGLSTASSSQMAANFSPWLQTAHDGITLVHKTQGIDQKRISVFGHSLGAQLALHEASSDSRVYSVVDMAGSFVLPTKNISHMPTVLILHGADDRTVPVQRERNLVAVLKRVGSTYSEHIFPGADHSFQSVPADELYKLIGEFLIGK